MSHKASKEEMRHTLAAYIGSKSVKSGNRPHNAESENILHELAALSPRMRQSEEPLEPLNFTEPPTDSSVYAVRRPTGIYEIVVALKPQKGRSYQATILIDPEIKYINIEAHKLHMKPEGRRGATEYVEQLALELMSPAETAIVLAAIRWLATEMPITETEST